MGVIARWNWIWRARNQDGSSFTAFSRPRWVTEGWTCFVQVGVADCLDDEQMGEGVENEESAVLSQAQPREEQRGRINSDSYQLTPINSASGIEGTSHGSPRAAGIQASVGQRVKMRPVFPCNRKCAGHDF